MSTIDDPQFLLRHLRTCFITSDDSGLCELLVEPDLIRDDQRKRSGSKLSSNSHSGSEHEMSISPDILSDMDFGGGRLRSNTALRIEKIKQEKTKRSKVKSIKWRHNDPNTEPDEATVEELFGHKEIKPRKTNKSTLTSLLKLSRDVGSTNPFNEYKQFNGENHVDKKSIDIYMTMQDGSQPLPVVVVSTATVQQTIGFACYKYTSQGRKPELHKDLRLYSLHMTEDDGEVDTDFPAFDHKQPISKFGFSKLALVMQRPARPAPNLPPSQKSSVRPTRSNDPHGRQRKTTATVLDRNTQLVTIHIPDHGSTKLLVDVAKVTVGQLIQMVQERRNLFSVANEKFQLGNEFNQRLHEDVLIADSSSREFYMTCSRTVIGARASSVMDTPGGADNSMFPDLDSVTSTDDTVNDASARDGVAPPTPPKKFTVNLINKVFSNQVQLSVSEGGVEIQPLNTKSALKSMLMKKTTVIDSASIVSCFVTKSRSSGKTAFSLHFNAGDLSTVSIRQYDFDAAESVASEIVSLVNSMIANGTPAASLVKSPKQRRQSSMY